MKKERIISLMLALFATATAVRAQALVQINSSTFPDANFRNIVKGKDIDKDQDGMLSTAERLAVTTLTVSSKSIESLKGVEHFFKLTQLNCEDNRLSSLDVSKITTLKTLYCSENRLTSLDVSKNTELTALYCYSNKIGHSDMLKLVNSLPTVTGGKFYVIDTKNSNEQNVCTKNQVAIATGKGWTVYDNNGGSAQEYAGSEPGIAINATNFPDENFRTVVAGTDIDKDADGYLSDEEIAAVTQLKVSNKNIASLKGIEFFTALKSLSCSFNQLTSLDVSKNTALNKLYCFYNKLTSLDVSKNTALTVLHCYGNKLTSLDVSKNTTLESLLCSYNQLTSLDVSKNSALIELDCDGNQLTSLDVSKNTALKVLDFSSNQLKSLDVSKNTALTELYCFNNQIKGDKMQALVNSLPTVTSGEFYVIDTKSSDEQNVCTKPQVKIATDKGWTVYDWNGRSWEQYAGSEPGIAINATNFPDENFRAVVAGTDIDKDADGYLSDEEIAAVTKLAVSYKNIASLKGIEFFTALEVLRCYNNQLTSLDLSKNTALTELNCSVNQLTSLDVSKNTALQYLWCENNQLTSLDVSKNTALISLDFSSNQLKSLDVSKNTALTELYCYGNQLTSLDVSKNTALKELYCFSNQIKEDKMQALVNSLPTVTEGVFYVIDTKSSNEQNVCTEPQVKIATDKGWTVYDWNGGSVQEYDGSVVTAIRSIEVSAEENGLWYTLDGKRLSGKPTQKGIYVRNGRKVVVK